MRKDVPDFPAHAAGVVELAICHSSVRELTEVWRQLSLADAEAHGGDSDVTVVLARQQASQPRCDVPRVGLCRHRYAMPVVGAWSGWTDAESWPNSCHITRGTRAIYA